MALLAGGRHPRPGRRGSSVPAPAERRDAPAGDDRDRAGGGAGAADRRRADHRARRDGAGPDPRGARPAARRARHGGAAHHPRPRRRGGPGRPRGGDVRRPDRRGGADRRALRARRRIPTPAGCSPRCRGSPARVERLTPISGTVPPPDRVARRAAASIPAARRRCRAARPTTRRCVPRRRRDTRMRCWLGGAGQPR